MVIGALDETCLIRDNFSETSNEKPHVEIIPAKLEGLFPLLAFLKRTREQLSRESNPTPE